MRRAAAVFNSSRIQFHALLSFPQPIEGMRVTPLRLPAPARCIHANLCRLAHGPGPQYLYKPLLHWVFPRDVKQVIVLDTDVVVVRDIAELWAQFRHFGTAVLGVANEQSNLYHGTSIGKNGGVQLLDLEKMRNSQRYAEALDYYASGPRYIGYLGDQTLYSFMAVSHSDLLFQLPCEWNRQLSMQFGFRNATVHACPRRCGLLHANFGILKCVATVMQSDPSCETWSRLRTGVSFSGAMPPQIASCPASRKGEFRRAATRFFSDCCRA
ncbi:hypothetical protein AB1Y20_000260 [Prymnesium parvum]|uniref:Hexosyltransferase n=1 Tax=Prymnesium parvum TaxID=97485 RepID=A0AB34K8V9_PRYPA